ncbi:macrophage mannose receptor 1-like [Patiria miniata]|uniref:Macrophage mannose receptor 1-like n=1 Tax=Patiria miniata TaxID=46514 RepID=A0A914A2G3_PATMI|nr:macrophage mannose receptor 1-like [Patiria miniata]
MWTPVVCGQNHRYVCKKPKIDDGTVHTPAPPPTPGFESRCGWGWEYDVASETCYTFRPDSSENWQDALYQCRVEGGDLISITGLEDQQFINSRLQFSGALYTWMGCNDLGREGGWEWSDTSPFAFVNWDSGEPSNGMWNSPLGQHCCTFISLYGTWADRECERALGYSCKRNAYIFKYFVTSTQRKLPDHSDVTRFRYNVWPVDCANLCMNANSFTCRSFDYRREDRACYLSSDDAASAGGLVTTYEGNHYDYYERDWTVLVPTAPPPLPSSYNCPTNWRGYDGYCYTFNTTQKNFQEAQSACRDMGAELVSIRDRNTNNFIRAYLHEEAPSENRLWIGLTDQAREGLFAWSDGEPVTFTHWSSGQPDNVDDEGCTAMNIDSGYWNDYVCWENYLSSLCRKPMDVAPPPPVNTSCPSNWVAWMGSCYTAYQTKTDWVDAGNRCASRGAQLVVIEDGYELAFISSALGLQNRDDFFIGLSDRATPGYYEWIDGSWVTYTNWANGQPDDRSGHCVTINSGPNAGYWTDRLCSNSYRYICEKARAGWPTSTPPTANPPTQPTDTDCSAGWIGYGANCFKPFEFSSPQEGATWLMAHSECENIGASLASFHHPNEEQHIVNSFAPTSAQGFWIALNDRRNEGGYEWSDGSVVQYTNWHTGQPDDNGRREECVQTYLSNTTGWFDARCEQPLNYICKIPKGVELRTTVDPSLSPGEPCADDPTWIHRYPYCYYFSSSSEEDGVLDWHYAEAWCKSKNSHLVSIHDNDERRFLVRYSDTFASYYWIGLRENGSHVGHYEWSDGTFLDYENWRTGQPDDRNGEEQCVEMNKFLALFPGRWSDSNCGVERQFICKRNVDDPPVATHTPTEVPTGGCPTGWWEYNHRCYMIGGTTLDTRKTWLDARTECQKTPGANLASIHDDNVQTLLAAFLISTEYDVWIGLSSLISGRFLWTDGTSFDYENWGYNQPDFFNTGNDTDCVRLMNEAEETGKWNDGECTTRNSYVCLMKPDPTIPESPFTPPPCPSKPGYIQYGQSCFKLDTSTKRSFSDAQVYCAADGATVASVLSGYEQALIQTLLNEYADKSAWLGLHRDSTTDALTWEDGWPLHYTNWGFNSPTNLGDCTVMAENLILYEDGEWATVSCLVPRYTVCKYNTATPPTPHPTSAAGYCPSGWTDFGSSCYLVPSNWLTKKSFAEARYDCEFNRGGDLVTIGSQAENQFVRQLAAEKNGVSEFILGLHRNTNGGWEWIDDTPASYVNWGSETPVNMFQNCVVMHLDSQGKWFGTYCSTRNHYMCEKPKSKNYFVDQFVYTFSFSVPYSSTHVPISVTGHGTLPPVVPTTRVATTVEGGHCPTGWLARGDYCYYTQNPSTDMLTWTEADAYCNNLGGYLASIHSIEENNFIRSRLEPGVSWRYWIGLRETAAGGSYNWSDKTDSSYTNWNPDEPNDYGGEEECAEMHSSLGTWNDMACGTPQPFVCKKLNTSTNPIPVPTPYPFTGGCEDGWSRVGYQCYRLLGAGSVSSSGLPYRQAKADCISRGAVLVTVSSPEVQIFLNALMGQQTSSHSWIGLNRLVGDFHWTDGSRLNYTYWAPGYPAGTGGCVHMLNDNTASGKWANVEGSDSESYFCQQPLNKSLPDTWTGIQCDATGYYKFGQACYRVEATPSSYAEAEANCEKDQGTLASIGDGLQEALIRSMLTYYDVGDAWIGLRRDSKGTFTWLNKNQLSYVNWDENEPSSLEGEGCVRMLAEKTWDNTDCSSTRASICQIGGVSPIPTSVTPPDCNMEGWEQDGGSCLLFNTGLMRTSRDEAQRKCWQDYRATLPAVHSDEQNEFIRRNATKDEAQSSGRVWLQMYRNSNGVFVYNDTDGSQVDYVNWAVGQPDGQSSGADCVAMDLTDGKWSDEFCQVLKADCVCQLLPQGYPHTGKPHTGKPHTGKPHTGKPHTGKPHTGGLSTGAVVGIVFGILIAIAIVLVAVYFVLAHRRGKGNLMEDRMITSTTGFENATYFSNMEAENKSDI